MEVLDSITFVIGVDAGEYSAGVTITDSVFEYFPKIVEITYSNQTYNYGWTLTGRQLFFGNAFETSNGSNVTIKFKRTI